ncbi:hypothetical protein N7510_008453 [Penicillium lagena]|uniref:uncharacterized protein n=1 Tax=Penicillium lagena TaxID=94218 RepID=UPI00253F9407|nr:uncharacterized protein N7510_008453 [Penicillium lagena]KAJ5605672.1 hypothetical protein N7510_008453 [Penicillium lagena]
MAELSIAASVAGLLSLGIQVTESLVKFYTTYKEQDTDVARTTESLDNLLGIFRSLDIVLQNRQFSIDEKDLVQEINQAIQKCDGIIEQLQSECDRFQQVSEANFKGRIQTAKNRVAYPFRKGTLQNLEEDIREIRDNLSIALNVLQLNGHKTTQNEISELKSLLERMNANHISSTIRCWLIAPDTAINHNAACAKRHTGTGLWFINGNHYANWLSQRNSFLWINGFAGCGKSILFSAAVQHTFRKKQHEQGVGIAFFYFTFKDESKQEASAMLRALLLQLSGQLRDGERDLEQLHDRYKSTTPPTEVLIAYLERMIRRFHDVYILLDALDESPRDSRREDLLTIIKEMRKWSFPGLHLLATSRDEFDIRESLDPQDDQTIIMKNSEIDRDIANFITYQLNNDSSLRKWEPHHEQIRKALAERAQGVFRYVECQLNVLKQLRLRTKHCLNKCLYSLPHDLEETYERILCGINEHCVDDVRRILTMLCFSARPLTVAELIHGYAVDLDEPPHLDREDRCLVDIESLCDICLGLIEIAPDGDEGQDILTVHISHFSVQEYLQSDRVQHSKAAFFALQVGPSHTEIAQICLVYLLEPMLSNIEANEENLKEFPLAYFAARNWFHHYKNSLDGKYKIKNLILKLFNDKNGSFRTWIRLHDVDQSWPRGATDGMASPLYYASLLGLEWILRDMIAIALKDSKRILDVVNSRGGIYGSALQAASSRGYENVVRTLLEQGADINAQGGKYAMVKGGAYGSSALQAACSRGHEKVVQILLEQGADVNAHRSGYCSALQDASSRGYGKVVQVLLERGANVNGQAGGAYGSPLRAACSRGHEKVVQILLDYGADINAQVRNTAVLSMPHLEFTNKTARMRSKRHHREFTKKMIQKLRGQGVDVNAQGEKYGSALLAACSRGHENVVQMLLDHGADVNAQGEAYGNALQVASSEGYETVVQMLLDHGANINARGEKRGADVNVQGGKYGSSLPAACCGGHEKVVQMLLDHGADITQGGEYGNALQAASSEGYEKVVQMLVNNGVEGQRIKL